MIPVNKCFLFVCILVASPAASVYAAAATSQEKAVKIYERLAGTKVSKNSPMIQEMKALVDQGNLLEAAQVATKDPDFYNITVKLFALPMSTRDETIKTPLNDFVASFIGVTRDQTDARELLTGNFYYQGSGTGIRSNLIPDLLLSNNHYADLESKRINLAANLTRVNGQQIATSATANVANPDPAGVLTSRSFMSSHALAGTNRRLVEFTFREFMCTSIDKWADTGASDARIGRDIDRFPSGDHNKFLTSCKGCHTVMDGFRGAFAKYDFYGTGLRHSDVNTRNGNASAGNFNIDANATSGVVNKMNKNNTIFPSGYITTDTSFLNHAIRPLNSAKFGWRGDFMAGTGVKNLGQVVANSKMFSECMVQRVFKTICHKTLDTTDQKEFIRQLADDFENHGYKLKLLFETIAIQPECIVQ